MPNTITDDASLYDERIDVIAAGDDRSAESVRKAFQSLANRTAYLRAKLQVEGISRLRLVDPGDWAALRALADSFLAADDGDTALMPTFGLYTFDYSGATTEALPWVVGTGVGRWYHALYGLLNAKPGLASKNQIRQVAKKTFSLGEIDRNSGAVYVDSKVAVGLAGCVPGDVLVIDGGANFSGSGYTRVAVQDGGLFPLNETECVAGRNRFWSTTHTVGSTGTVGVVVQIQNAILLAPSSIRVIHLRP